MSKTAVPLPQDGRGFWMLPQNVEEGGYYNYGTPGNGAAQYCHPKLLSLLLMIGNKWAAFDNRRFGVGNISLADGPSFSPHHSHRNGLQMDIRAFRKDGKNLPVTYKDAAYDRVATRKLIDMLFDSGKVSTIYFNDRAIPRVLPMVGHDNHFHVEVQ